MFVDQVYLLRMQMSQKEDEMKSRLDEQRDLHQSEVTELQRRFRLQLLQEIDKIKSGLSNKNIAFSQLQFCFHHQLF